MEVSTKQGAMLIFLIAVFVIGATFVFYGVALAHTLQGPCVNNSQCGVVNGHQHVCSSSSVCVDATGGGIPPPGGGIPPDGSGLSNPLNFETLPELLDAIAGFLFGLAIPLAIIVIIVGAFQLLTAGGNEQRIATGKKTITWAVIGFVIVLLAGSIAALIKNFLEAG